MATKETPIRVIIAEPDPDIRRLLTLLLREEDDISIVARTGDGERALEGVQRLKPDVLLMAYDMAEPNCLEIVRWMTGEIEGVEVIVMGSYPESTLKAALAVGARDYILKEGRFGIARAIRRAALLAKPPSGLDNPQ